MIKWNKKISGNLFTWGQSDFLGHGYQLNKYKPTKISYTQDNQEIKDPISYVGLGKTHSGFVTNKGHLFTYGLNQTFQLGHNPEQREIMKPSKVPLQNIKAVQCGNNFTLALNQEGKVFSWGSSGLSSLWSKLLQYSNRHALGVQTKQHLKIPTQIPFQQKITQISVGFSFCLALSETGKTYSWGSNQQGQLGLNTNYQHYFQPQLIPSLAQTKIEKILAGHNQSLAVSSKGEVFTWGANQRFEAGQGNKQIVRDPVILEVSKIVPIKDVALGQNTLMVQNMLDQIWVSGMKFWEKPTLFRLPSGVTPNQIVCGQDYFAVVFEKGVAYIGGPFKGRILYNSDLDDSVQITNSGLFPSEIVKLYGKYTDCAAILKE